MKKSFWQLQGEKNRWTNFSMRPIGDPVIPQVPRNPLVIYNYVQEWGNNQGNQGYSGNQKNGIQGQRPDMKNRHTQQRT